MNKVKKILKEFSGLPKFDDGRINFHNVNKAPGIVCFLKYKNGVLIVKRSNKVHTNKNKWFGIGGYLDNPNQTIKEKVLEELKEEVKVNKKDIAKINIAKPWEFYDPIEKKTWIHIPILVELKSKVKIKVNGEASEFKWIKPEDISKFDTVYNLREDLKRVLENE